VRNAFAAEEGFSGSANFLDAFADEIAKRIETLRAEVAEESEETFKAAEAEETVTTQQSNFSFQLSLSFTVAAQLTYFSGTSSATGEEAQGSSASTAFSASMEASFQYESSVNVTA
jgi:hypothetical protein